MTNDKLYEELQIIKEKLNYCHNEIGHLPELRKEISQMRECMTTLKVAVGKLEVKSGIIGAIAGAFTGASMFIADILKK